MSIKLFCGILPIDGFYTSIGMLDEDSSIENEVCSSFSYGVGTSVGDGVETLVEDSVGTFGTSFNW